MGSLFYGPADAVRISDRTFSHLQESRTARLRRDENFCPPWPQDDAEKLRFTRWMRAASPALWSVQEPGHCTATLQGVTFGHVVTVPDGSFIAFDGQATPLGRHHTLRAAQLSTLRAAGLTDVTAILHRLSLLLATITGACALMLLAAGVLMLSATP